MNVASQRLIDKYVGQGLCLLLSALHAALPRKKILVDASGKPRPRAVAILMLSEMGSMVLAQPMVAYLKARYGAIPIHVVQLGKNQEIASLLRFEPAHMHAIDDSSLPRLLSSLWRVLRDLRHAQVDAVIDCELFARISAVLAYLCGATLRAGFTAHTQEGLYRGNFINCAIPYNPYRAIADQFITLARALDKPQELNVLGGFPRSKALTNETIPFAADAQLKQIAPLTLTGAELAQAVDQLNSDFPTQLGKPLVLIYPGGGILPIRAWPENYFANTAEALLQAGYAIGFIGLPADKQLAQSLCQVLNHPCALDLTGYTKSIRALLVLFFHAKLLITNDGGPGHFAALTPIHTLMFFGPETPALYAPLPSSMGGQTVCFYSNSSCSPCLTAYNHRNSACDGNNVCLKAISPEEVTTHALRLLAL